ncbi:MAG: hypothetical protein JNJ57_04515 [Saprospiraceae bacterium]|nr:hypothetical protein [Saprospiraceae bacterium]
MMKQSGIVKLLFLLLFSSQMKAQDVHVYYDAFKDSLYFLQNGKAVENPEVREGAKVILHVDNYNNYLYELAFEVENKEVMVSEANAEGGLKGLLPSGAGVINPLDMLFSGSGDQLLGAFKMFPGLSGKDLKDGGSGWGTSPEETALQEQVKQLKKAEKTFETIRERIFDLDEELESMEDEAQAKLAGNRLQTFAAAEIAQLRYNPLIEPKQIKQLTGEYMQRIFKESNPNKITLEQVLTIADAQADISKYVQRYSDKVKLYSDEAAACYLAAKGFSKFKFPNSNVELISQKAEEFSAAVNTKLGIYQTNVERLNEKLDKVQTLDPRALAALRTTYLELSNNSFSKTFTQTAKGENMTIKLKLTPNDSLSRLGIKERVTPVDVGVYGGIKVKASVGLSFGQFFNRPKQYFVRDSILQSSDKDAFSPILTSFVHFYAPRNRSVSVAGSFGVGFPIGGGENLQSVSFFLGPSLVFGKTGRVVLTGGIMGGKADRLSQGYQIGDVYYSDSREAPTTSVYELGYFLGFSFNLTGG